MIVIKVGGAEGIDLDALCDDVARLLQQDQQLVLVHGASAETNRVAEALGHPPRFLTSPSGFTSRHTDRRTLEIESENYERFSGRPLYKHLDRIPRIKRGYIEEVYQMDHGDDLGEAMGWSNSFGIGHNRYTASASADESEDLVEIVEYWDRDDRVIYLANGETPIWDAPNPYDDKEIPFVAARCTVLDAQRRDADSSEDDD